MDSKSRFCIYHIVSYQNKLHSHQLTSVITVEHLWFSKYTAVCTRLIKRWSWWGGLHPPIHPSGRLIVNLLQLNYNGLLVGMTLVIFPPLHPSRFAFPSNTIWSLPFFSAASWFARSKQEKYCKFNNLFLLLSPPLLFLVWGASSVVRNRDGKREVSWR